MNQCTIWKITYTHSLTRAHTHTNGAEIKNSQNSMARTSILKRRSVNQLPNIQNYNSIKMAILFVVISISYSKLNIDLNITTVSHIRSFILIVNLFEILILDTRFYWDARNVCEFLYICKFWKWEAKKKMVKGIIAIFILCICCKSDTHTKKIPVIQMISPDWRAMRSQNATTTNETLRLKVV